MPSLPFQAKKPLAVIDTECYYNYFLLKARRVDDGKTVSIPMYDGLAFNRERASKIMNYHETISFNGNSYDLLMIAMAIRGFSCAKLKEWSDRIIVGGMKPWHVEEELGFRIPKWDHIDLIEVSPGQASLKIYGGRVHSRKMQDLPIEPDQWIEPEEYDLLDSYCGNDLGTTEDLARKLSDQLSLRRTMSAQYGLNLMSKSDAQIAEAVIRKRMFELTGEAPQKPGPKPGYAFKYVAPKSLKYKTKPLRDLLERVTSSTFRVSRTGKVEMPPELDDFAIDIGKGVYRMGIGGLHSSEETVSHVADDDTILLDRDVASYYPKIILNNRFYPTHLGPDFLTVFGAIVDERLAAKARKDTVVANSLKITINGTFGKLGSQWSLLYSPDLMIQVTVSGQLFLLMLIESIHLAGIEVVSANTDGIVIKCPKSRYNDLNAIVAEWEKATGFETEETRYRALYSRDVNNYVAVKTDGSHKGKGAFAKPELSKSPTNEICVNAAVRYLIDGTPVEATIRTCRDIRKFVTIRTVKGGAIYAGQKVEKPDPDGKGQMRGRAVIDKYWEPKMVFSHVEGGSYLGKAVRFYYSKESKGPILYKETGNTVPKSDGCKPMMELTDKIPRDLDHQWYIDEANSILKDIGAKADTSNWYDNLI